MNRLHPGILCVLVLTGSSELFGDSTRRHAAIDPRELRYLGAFVRPGSETFRLAFSPDGRHLAALGADGIVRLFATRSWAKLREFPGNPAGVRGLAFSPEGKYIAAGRLNGEVMIWETETGAVHQALQGTHRGVYNLAFSPDGKRLLAAEDNQCVQVWSVADGGAVKAPEDQATE